MTCSLLLCFRSFTLDTKQAPCQAADASQPRGRRASIGVLRDNIRGRIPRLGMPEPMDERDIAHYASASILPKPR
jgi:hypothetical protein